MLSEETRNKILKPIKLNKIIKDNYDFIFLFIFLFSLILGTYYLTQTYNQALWFDEADYLNFGKYVAFGSPEWGLGSVRPPLFPIISALFFKIGLGEIGLRILMLLFYLSNVLLIYLIGKELLNKKAGIVASIVTAVFWSHLFFSFRMLVDVPVLTFWLLTTYLFVYGYINNKSRLAVKLILPVLFIGFLFKYLNAVLGIIILLYLLITERLNFIKNKGLQLSVLITAIMTIPFFLFQYFYYKNPIAFLTTSLGDRTTLGKTFTDFLILNIQQLTPMVSYTFVIILIIGLVRLFEIFLGLDLIIKNKNTELSKKFFLFLWLIISLIFISKIGFGYYIEERYSFMLFAAMFLIIGIGLDWLYEIIKKHNKVLSLIIITLIIIFGAYQNLSKADNLIKDKAESFKQVKQAGQFLESHLEHNQGYLSPATSAEIQYHSNRKNFGSDIKNYLNDTKVKYAVLSGFNQMPEGYTKFIQENQKIFNPVAVYYIDKEQKQPIVIIFEIIRN